MQQVLTPGYPHCTRSDGLTNALYIPRSAICPRPLSLLSLMLPAVLSCWNPLGAAEITLEDGQVLRGEVVEKSGDFVILDVQVDGGQARVKLPATRIASIRMKPEPKSPRKRLINSMTSLVAVPTTHLYAHQDHRHRRQAGRSHRQSPDPGRRLNIKHVVFDVDSAGPPTWRGWQTE